MEANRVRILIAAEYANPPAIANSYRSPRGNSRGTNVYHVASRQQLNYKDQRFMKRLAFIVVLSALSLLIFVPPLAGQSNSGELRLKVTDPAGLGVKTTVQIVSRANQYSNTLETNDQGSLDVRRLPYGIYQLQITRPGFADVSEAVEIRSAIPTEYAVRLQLPSVNETVTVTAPTH